MIALLLNAQLWGPSPRIALFEIHPDRTVIFRISSPEAIKVIFAGTNINNKVMRDKGPMKKDMNGVWDNRWSS